MALVPTRNAGADSISRVVLRRLRSLPTAAAFLLGAAVAALAAAAGAVASPARLESPRLAEITRGPSAIPDAALSTRSSQALLTPGSYWGGQYTAKTGESVTVYVSRAYPEDPATAQRWADFLAGLVHGPELAALTAYLAPLDEVQQACGPSALACYSPDRRLLVAPGDDPSADVSAEAVVTHEYGHHVEASRSNAPWSALTYGPKRWASSAQVCARARAGTAFPGAERLPDYRLNPAEAYAEVYRVLNERNAGLPQPPWQVVAQSFYPDEQELAAASADVTAPWQAPAPTTRTGVLSSATRVLAYAFTTPLDGSLRVTLRPPTRTRIALDVYSPAAKRVAHVVATKAVSVRRTICGQRTLKVRVSRLKGSGAFTLAVATP